MHMFDASAVIGTAQEAFYFWAVCECVLACLCNHILKIC